MHERKYKKKKYVAKEILYGLYGEGEEGIRQWNVYIKRNHWGCNI